MISEIFAGIALVSFCTWMGGIISMTAYGASETEERFYVGLLLLAITSIIIALVTL
jgi:hypothetical protein